jgi:hypothetical protein
MAGNSHTGTPLIGGVDESLFLVVAEGNPSSITWPTAWTSVPVAPGRIKQVTIRSIVSK